MNCIIFCLTIELFDTKLVKIHVVLHTHLSPYASVFVMSGYPYKTFMSLRQDKKKTLILPNNIAPICFSVNILRTSYVDSHSVTKYTFQLTGILT